MQVSKISNARQVSMRANADTNATQPAQNNNIKETAKKYAPYAVGAAVLLFGGVALFKHFNGPKALIETANKIIGKTDDVQKAGKALTEDAEKLSKTADRQFVEVMDLLKKAAPDAEGKLAISANDAAKDTTYKFADGLMEELVGDKVVRATKYTEKEGVRVADVISQFKDGKETTRFEFEGGLLKRAFDEIKNVADGVIKDARAFVFDIVEKAGEGDKKVKTSVLQKVFKGYEGTDKAWKASEEYVLDGDAVKTFKKVIAKAEGKESSIADEIFEYDKKELTSYTKYNEGTKTEQFTFKKDEIEYVKDGVDGKDATKHTFVRKDGKATEVKKEDK